MGYSLVKVFFVPVLRAKVSWRDGYDVFNVFTTRCGGHRCYGHLEVDRGRSYIHNMFCGSEEHKEYHSRYALSMQCSRECKYHRLMIICSGQTPERDSLLAIEYPA